MIRSLRWAFAFLTIAPVAPAGPPRNGELARSAIFFPVVAAAVGAACWGVDLACSGRVPDLVRGLLVVATAAALTRALHLDGLADTADALGSMRDRKGMLEVMRDPHVGAFGATALVIVVLVQAACVADIPEGGRLAGLVSAAVASRATMTVACAVFPYARREGKGGGFVGRVGLAGALVACAAAAALAWGADHLATGSLYQAGALATLGVGSGVGLVASVVFAAKLGGATGDTVGASGEIAATASLVWTVGVWA